MGRSEFMFIKSKPDKVTCISRLKKYCILLLQVLTRRRKGKYVKAEVSNLFVVGRRLTTVRKLKFAVG